MDKGLESNKESIQSYYDSCNAIINSLQKHLEHENLSFEEKKYIFDKMHEISKMMGEKDSENKKFTATMVVLGAAAIGVVTLALASALGEIRMLEQIILIKYAMQ